MIDFDARDDEAALIFVKSTYIIPRKTKPDRGDDGETKMIGTSSKDDIGDDAFGCFKRENLRNGKITENVAHRHFQ
jgi:hypothetical protein